MEFSRVLLRILNALVSVAVGIFLFVAGAYSAYALWDNNQVYTAAENVQTQVLGLKPEVEEDQTVSFSDLLAVNKDVCAWISLDNTQINYPVLQGETNLTYINTDIYGEFALAGSIFLDSRNDRNFGDTYSILYGHHMEGGRMFGDLDLYKDKEFFAENSAGMIMTPNSVYNLEVYACVVVAANDSVLFDPRIKAKDIGKLTSYVEKKALFLNEETAQKVRELGKDAKILAFSTCTSEFTDARTILLTVMTPYNAPEYAE